MIHLFYLSSIVFVIYSIFSMINPKKLTNFFSSFKELKNSKELTNDKIATGCLLALISVFFLIWVLVGLLTFQWPLFILLLVLSYIPARHYVIRFIKSFVVTNLLIFILLNAYHFNIDVFDFIKNLI